MRLWRISFYKCFRDGKFKVNLMTELEVLPRFVYLFARSKLLIYSNPNFVVCK